MKHLQFKHRLRSILFDEIAVEENSVLSQYECPVGKWIYNEALLFYKDLPAIIELERCHADLHVTARKLVALYKSGKVQESRKGLEEIETIAAALTAILDRTEKEVLAKEAGNKEEDPATDNATILKDLLKQNQALDQKIKDQAAKANTEADFFRRLLAASPAVLWMSDENGVITYISDTWFSWTGTAPVTTSKQWPDLTEPGDRERVKEIFNKHFKDRFKFEIECSFNHAGSVTRSCMAIGQPYYDSNNGNFSGFTGSIVDITDKKTVEADLNQKINHENEVMHNFFMQAPAMFCILRGPDHVFELTNPGYKNLIGGRDVIGMEVRNALPELAGQGFFELLDQVYKTQIPFTGREMEINIDTGDGPALRYLNFCYQPIINRQKETDGILVFVYDVTEIVESRKKVEHSEHELRSLIESAPFPIAVYLGKDMQIHLANQSMLDVYGKGNDVIGRSYKEILPELGSQKIFDQLEAVFTTGEAFHENDQRLDILHEGELKAYYFNYSFTPLNDRDGKTYGIINTGADVTVLNVAKQQIEQSESRFRQMADFMPQMVWTAAADGNLDYYSQAVYDFSGLSLETIQKNGWLSIVHPDDRDENVKQWIESVTSGKPFNFHHRFRHHSGEFRWQSSRAVPIKDEAGTITTWIGISSDIEDQKRIEETLEQMVTERTLLLKDANYKLEMSNQELSQFAFIASHDLQEPLRKIVTFIDRLLTEKIELPASTLNYLNKIDTAAKKMSNLVKDILEFSIAGQTTENFRETDLNTVLKNLVVELEVDISGKQAGIRVDKLPVLHAIPAQIGQLFQNLLTNALKFSKKTGLPDIRISAKEIPGTEIPALLHAEIGKKYWKITVTDNGIGFDQQYAQRIFTIFQRLHGKSAYEGTGIGLALCKKIMDNHRGFIDANGVENEGAVFNLYFPEDLFYNKQHKHADN